MVLSEISVSLACNFATTTAAEPAVVAVAAAVVADPNDGRIFIPTTSRARLMPRRPSTPVARPVAQVVPEFYNQGAPAAPMVQADRSLWHDPNRRRFLQLGSRERHLCHYCGSPLHFERACPKRDAYDARVRLTSAPADPVARLQHELAEKQKEIDDLRSQLARYRSMDQFIADFQTQASLQ